MLRTQPLLAHLAREGRPAYVTRHWACGPHISLHLQMLDGEDAVPEPLLSKITRQLRALPDSSTMPFDWTRAARIYPQLAHHEQFPGQYWPPLPHGHVRVAERQRAVGVRGGPLTEHLIDDACVALNEVILGGLRQVRDGLPVLRPDGGHGRPHRAGHRTEQRISLVPVACRDLSDQRP